MDIDEVPVKTVRVTFHIFQKDDGTGNLQNNTEVDNYLDAIEWSMNQNMEFLAMFDFNTSSPYHQDSKIRYDVVDIQFWQNTEMWRKGDDKKTSAGGFTL